MKATKKRAPRSSFPSDVVKAHMNGVVVPFQKGHKVVLKNTPSHATPAEYWVDRCEMDSAGVWHVHGNLVDSAEATPIEYIGMAEDLRLVETSRPANFLFDAEFEENFSKALLAAAKTHAEKKQDYNGGGISYRVYTIPAHFYVGQIWNKACRLISLTEGGQRPTFESLEDSLRDILVYAALAYAEEKTKRDRGIVQ